MTWQLFLRIWSTFFSCHFHSHIFRFSWKLYRFQCAKYGRNFLNSHHSNQYKWHNNDRSKIVDGYKWNAGFIKSASDCLFKWFRKALSILSLFIWHLIWLRAAFVPLRQYICVCVCHYFQFCQFKSFGHKSLILLLIFKSISGIFDFAILWIENVTQLQISNE